MHSYGQPAYGQPQTAFAQPAYGQHVLKVSYAGYGAGNKMMDVTDFVKHQVHEGRRAFATDVIYTSLGDPLPGVVKHLVVVFKKDGKKHSVLVKDGEPAHHF
eukprot:TRINITY_DN379_c0_g1_i2.p2 TRINITY_DN379_c0_g1~~TRINITY_DN379_c0_g1_i2.p2  ORF type:complete len:102 (-),score=23.25 TRINITY_DN379_c0_g1_i2:86-391(-)